MRILIEINIAKGVSDYPLQSYENTKGLQWVAANATVPTGLSRKGVARAPLVWMAIRRALSDFELHIAYK